MAATDLTPAAQALVAALAAGMLVGLERGWRERELPEGGRVAGLRTFTLIALLGATLRLASPGSPLLPAAGALGVAALFAVAYRSVVQQAGSLSITTAVAALLTYGLGVLAAEGQALLALASAVVIAMLLDLKSALHRGLQLIERAELSAVLQLALFTAVILPLLPDRGYGPYGAINPFRLWIAVILIAALSLTGHLATRWRGAHQGLLWVGLIGGLASSTAATLTLARTTRDQPALAIPAASAVVAACSVMFVRMATVVALLRPELAPYLGSFLLLLGVAGFGAAAWLWRSQAPRQHEELDAQTRPFDLPTALGFALALGVIAVLSRGALDWLGLAGVYAVALVSGLADVDAVVISSVGMHSQGQLGTAPTAIAILLAALSNMVVKAAMAWTIGGKVIGLRVAAGFAFILAAGGLAAAAAVAAGV